MKCTRGGALFYEASTVVLKGREESSATLAQRNKKATPCEVA